MLLGAEPLESDSLLFAAPTTSSQSFVPYRTQGDLLLQGALLGDRVAENVTFYRVPEQKMLVAFTFWPLSPDLCWESSGFGVFSELAGRRNGSPFLFWATLMDDTQLQRPPLGHHPCQPVC